MSVTEDNNAGYDTKKLDFYSVDFLFWWHKEGQQHFIDWLRSEVRKKISEEK